MHECVSACTRAKWCADGVSSAIGALVPRDKQLVFFLFFLARDEEFKTCPSDSDKAAESDRQRLLFCCYFFIFFTDSSAFFVVCQHVLSFTMTIAPA